MKKTYEEAVEVLSERLSLRLPEWCDSIPQVLMLLSAAGIEVSDLDRLSAIHVSGTKGKGSTCAFTESILRHHNYKTGFLSSPHLVETRERVRINGRPISREDFSRYFWDFYETTSSYLTTEAFSKVTYFTLITSLSYHIFLKENVDVAIIEVGLGGKWDSTNVLRKPIVCGITNLDLEHTDLMGDKIEGIAWHKAGIMKEGVPVVSVPQPGDCVEVFLKEAKEKGCPLYMAPDMNKYNWGVNKKDLGISGSKQPINASVALQLSHIWLEDHALSIEERNGKYRKYLANEDTIIVRMMPGLPFSITENMSNGLRYCSWPGRCQIIQTSRINYYLDSAHTVQGIEACASWFSKNSSDNLQKNHGRVIKVLLFNISGHSRSAENLLFKLVPCGFDYALFCPNITSKSQDITEQRRFSSTKENGPEENKKTFQNLQGEFHVNKTCGSSGLDLVSSCNHNQQPDCRNVIKRADNLMTYNSQDMPTTCHTFNCIDEALQWLNNSEESERKSHVEVNNLPPFLSYADEIEVLVTGSMYLVGGVLSLIKPNIND